MTNFNITIETALDKVGKASNEEKRQAWLAIGKAIHEKKAEFGVTKKTGSTSPARKPYKDWLAETGLNRISPQDISAAERWASSHEDFTIRVDSNEELKSLYMSMAHPINAIMVINRGEDAVAYFDGIKEKKRKANAKAAEIKANIKEGRKFSNGTYVSEFSHVGIDFQNMIIRLDKLEKGERIDAIKALFRDIPGTHVTVTQDDEDNYTVVQHVPEDAPADRVAFDIKLKFHKGV